MGQNQINEYLEAMERAAEKYSVSKESARAALVEAGIVDRHGELTEHYRPPHVHAPSESPARLPRVR
jgi:hypothetical protein